MKAKDYSISGIYMRGYLASLRNIVGNQYGRLLKQAGLEQYTEKYPPFTREIAARGYHIMALEKAVSEAISVDLYLLYQRNLGREFARNTAIVPGLKEKIATLRSATGSDPALVLQTVEAVIALRKEHIDEDITCLPATTGQGVVIFYKQCVQCAHIEQSEKPVCTVIATFYKELLFQLLGKRFQVDEIRCGPVFHDHECQFLVQ